MPISPERWEEVSPGINQYIQEFVDTHPDKAASYSPINLWEREQNFDQAVIISYQEERVEGLGLGVAITLHHINNDQTKPVEISLQPMAYKVYPEHTIYYIVIPPDDDWLKYQLPISREHLIGAFKLQILNSSNSARITNLRDAHETFLREGKWGYYEKGKYTVLQVPFDDKVVKLTEGLAITQKSA